jgi:hypothetical protein
MSASTLADHRVQLVADAVISAYVAEISRPPRPEADRDEDEAPVVLVHPPVPLAA